MGCGSGILSIGALLLGADSVIAVDIDEVASKIAKENLELNGFTEPKAMVYCGNVLEDRALEQNIGNGYDVICANIVASITPVIFNSKIKATQLKTNNAQTGMIESVFLKNIMKAPLIRRATIKPKIISILINLLRY